MLEVLPIQTKTEQAEICARAGVAFQENDMAYRASVDGELTAVCQFCDLFRSGRFQTEAFLI